MTKAEQVIELIETEYISRNEACRRLNYPTSTFRDQHTAEGLTARYARACEDRELFFLDEIKRISEEKAGVIHDEDGNERLDSGFQQRQKLRIDAIKWMLSRMNPKKYGDKIETVTHTGKSLPDWMNEGGNESKS